MLNISLKRSDAVGVVSSGLCMIHCIATPFFFLAATCSTTCCDAAPMWWQWLDYFFLVVSFFAVFHSVKTAKSKGITYGLWISWASLFLLILNAKFGWLHIPENTKFIPAFSLIGFHLYNFRHRQCETGDCC